MLCEVILGITSALSLMVGCKTSVPQQLAGKSEDGQNASKIRQNPATNIKLISAEAIAEEAKRKEANEYRKKHGTRFTQRHIFEDV